MRQLRLGAVAPLTGPRAAYGAMLKTVVCSIAEQHGLAPSCAKVVDDQARADLGERAARQLIALGAPCVVGHFSSASAAAAAPLYHEQRIPLLLPATTRNVVPHEEGPWVTRLCGTNTEQAQTIVRHLAELGRRSLCVLADRGPYADELAAALRLASGPALAQSDPPDAYVLVGPHHFCMRELERLAAMRCSASFIVCDDCGIADFVEPALRFDNLQIFAARPSVSFRALTERAVRAAFEWSLRESRTEAPVIAPARSWEIVPLAEVLS